MGGQHERIAEKGLAGTGVVATRLIRALDDKQSESHVAMHQTATTNPPSAIK
jgi:hypothetical protein